MGETWRVRRYGFRSPVDGFTLFPLFSSNRCPAGNCAAAVSRVYAHQQAPGQGAWFEPGGGHRPYFVYREALERIHQHLGTPALTRERIRTLPTVNSGVWRDTRGIRLETLYGTDLLQRGAALPDIGLRPTPREQLACLKPAEVGTPEFTLEGWLRQIDTNSDER